MNHDPYARVVPGSRFAVLMIHGIAGTPAHFRDLLPVVPADWSLYNIMLDGHGGSVSDFAATSMKKWKHQVCEQLEQLLARHEQVLVVAHSMGTLFAIQAALDHPDRIPALFLLAVPLRPRVKVRTMLAGLRVVRGNIAPDDRAALDMMNDTSIRLERKLWKYIGWLPRLLELLAECRRIRRLLPGLKVPCRSYSSRHDELVSARSVRDLQKNACIQNTLLHSSGHFAYSAQDTLFLQRELGNLIREIQAAQMKNAAS